MLTPGRCHDPAVDRRSWGLLVTLGAVWGSSFLLTALAIQDLSVPVVSFLRTGVGALVLVPVALATGTLMSLRRHAGALLLVGVVQLAGPFLLIGYGQLSVPSGLAGILVASTPLWTALLAVGLDHEERSHGWALAGIGIGIVGVALLLGVELAGSLEVLVGAAALLMAGLGYALAGFLAKRRLRSAQPLGAAAASMVAGSVVLAPFAVATLPDTLPGIRATGAAVVLGAVSGGLGWLMYYKLIASVGPARAAISMYLMPAFAVVYGALLLDERVTLGTVAGLVLVVAGSWLAAGGGPRPSASPAADAGGRRAPMPDATGPDPDAAARAAAKPM